LIDVNDLDSIDIKKMYSIYDEWPEISQNAYNSELEPITISEIKDIVFAGMGGSGAIGDIFSAIFSKSSLHVSVIKGYVLPKTVNKNTLVVATSVSGNTVETLSVLEQAKNIGCKIISFSSGGKIEDFSQKNNLDHRKIEQIHSPRSSFTNYLYGILKVLKPVLPIDEVDILDSIKQLKITRNNISSKNLTENNSSLSLAYDIKGIPMIYYPFGLMAAAIRFKNSLQENAKQQSMTEDILEACHNGIVSWEKHSTVQPILIEGKDDFVKTKERWKIIREYFQINEIPFKEISSIDGNILSKLINLIYVLDYATLYYSVLIKTDPSPTKSIDFIKSKL
jgi:glucose/mannose-6-phosphate isomerase